MTFSEGHMLGPYEIESQVGAGGMGEVYRARDARLDRTVAIKILRQESISDADARARFEREAKVISSLNHPNICTLYDVGHQEGIDYLVMEYLEGETLESKLKKGKINTDVALGIGIQIADALNEAHQRGLVHRDLKPSNILITKDGAKLLDFGLAKYQAGVVTGTNDETRTTPVTEAGTIVGTLQYMSPEQIEGRDIDSRSDIFSFGTVLYEMLTGKRAFSGDSKASLMSSIMKEEPSHINDLLPHCSRILGRLVHKSLAKNASERWQSTKDLRDELEWATSGVSKSPDSVTEKVRSGLPTRIALVLLSSALFFFAYAWYQTDKRSEQSEINFQKADKSRVFLSDVLTSSFPHGYGDETTVLDIVNKASEKLGGSFNDDPETEAELRISLGNAYSRVGHFRESVRELNASLALHEEVYGVSHPKTLSLLSVLSRKTRALGDNEALLDVSRKKETATEELFGSSHQKTLWAKDMVAYSLERLGEIDAAVEKMKESWVGFKDVIKVDTSWILDAQIQYAWLLHKQGKVTESMMLAREAYNLAHSVDSGESHDAKSILAAIHIVQGNIDSAKALYGNQKAPTTFGIERTFQGQFDLASKPFQLIVFFETWCPFSRQSMADLALVDRQYRQFGLDVCGMTRVNRSAKEEEMEGYLNELDVEFTVVKENGRSWNYFECDGTPSIRLLHDGYLVWEQRYYTSDPISSQMLESMVAFGEDNNSP